MSTLFLEKQILATIVYYDILDYPLTAFEVFLYLVNKNQESGIRNQEFPPRCSLSAEDCSESRVFSSQSSAERLRRGGNNNLPFTIYHLLNNSEYLKKYINQKHGFYFLKKTNTVETRHCLVSTDIKINIVHQRLNRKKLADQKWKKAKKIFWLMQITPFLKMVLVSGSLAMGNSKNESDIDLIITAKKRRIWTVRTFVTLLTSVLGARRHSNITKNKICLNHYITDKSLKIPFESLYNAQSYVHLINVYNGKKDKKIFQKFQGENKWIKKYARNYKPSELGGFRSIGRNKILGSISKIFEIILSGKFGDCLEKKLSEIQSGRIKKDKLYKKSGGRITIDDDQLEFHPDSHEADIIPEFNKRMEKLGLPEFGGQKDSGLTPF